MEVHANNTEIPKRRISPALKIMEIGTEEIFPICQFVSVWTAINRVKKTNKFRFTTSTTKETIKVTRIQ